MRLCNFTTVYTVTIITICTVIYFSMEHITGTVISISAWLTFITIYIVEDIVTISY
jgi:hypothetical protein